MISKKLEKALNEQIKVEAEASFKYLGMAAWCEQQSLSGCASFFYAQSEEERAHMLKIFHYVNDVEGNAITPAIKQPTANFKDIKDVCEKSLKSEQEVTKAIHGLSELAASEKDYATYNFVQFFVNEQREEELSFINILDKIKLIGTEGMGLYYIDKEMEELAGKPADESI